jgi:hypothetical protein
VFSLSPLCLTHEYYLHASLISLLLVRFSPLLCACVRARPTENADLKRFKEDYLNERRSMFKKVGDKISSNRKIIKVNSERERRHMERDLLNAKDQLREEIALRSELEVTITAIKKDNARLRQACGEAGTLHA